MWQNETAKKIHWLWHHAWFLFFLPFHSPLNQWGDMLLLASSTYKCSFNIILCIISVYRWIILIILKALHSIVDLLHMMLLNIQTNQIKPFEIYCVFWLKWTSVNWINFKRKKKNTSLSLKYYLSSDSFCRALKSWQQRWTSSAVIHLSQLHSRFIRSKTTSTSGVSYESERDNCYFLFIFSFNDALNVLEQRIRRWRAAARLGEGRDAGDAQQQ